MMKRKYRDRGTERGMQSHRQDKAFCLKGKEAKRERLDQNQRWIIDEYVM